MKDSYVEPREVFNNIYKHNKWIIGSGLGSVPAFNRPSISFINNFIDSNNDVQTILDIGCGDMQFGSKLHLKNKQYIGCDVSDFILNKVRAKYPFDNMEFLLLNAVTDELPKADLVIVRDVLLHLPNADITKLLDKLEMYKYVLIQTNISVGPVDNRDIKTGEFRLLDITEHPFNKKTYSLAHTYTEVTFKILNPILRLIGLKPHYKGIYLKR